MVEITDRTRGHTVRTRDLALVAALQLLWLAWGHVVVLTHLADPAPLPSSPTVPRASRLDRDTNAAAG